MLALFTLSIGVLGNQISRIINRIRDKKEIENLRISVESKLILARDRLERENIFVYILSEPDRTRDYHVWLVTQANGINLNILVYDNGEIELLR